MHKVILILVLSLSVGCAQNKEVPTASNNVLYKGVSWVSPSQPIAASSFKPLKDINANWTAIIPFGFIRKGEYEVFYNLSWQWWGERDAGVSAMVSYAHAQDIEVMLKPQVWITDGDFTGDFKLGTEEGWQELEQSYYQYILHFARLADSLQCGAFCIGTEWKNFHQKRPQFWSVLIDSVRANYNGTLTYAGNWDSYQSFPHWSKLDLIGIDAYFPVSEAQTPTVAQCVQGWQTWLNAIEKHQKEIGKPVILTEYGYRSSDHCASEPWQSNHFEGVNLEAQYNAYLGLYEAFWGKDWFAGGFLWKWHPDHSQAGGTENNRFTPQNKPVEQLIKEWYAK